MNERTDEELLDMFRTEGDEQAFAELMSRYRHTVLGAARSVVGGSGAAEDILQATFLTLARKAGSLDGSHSLAGWLHHVAVCLARDTRRNEARRAVREKEAAMIDVEPDTSPSLSEALLAALHEELAGLSEAYRVPVILHHIEGLGYEQAAAAIGCNAKTFSSNLTRARQKLRERLARRGVTLSITALVAGLGQSASAAELPAGFVASTCAAAGGGAVSAQVTALLESALKMLFWAKVKTVAAVCAVAVLVGGAGVGAAVTLPLLRYQEDDNGTAATLSGCVYAWGMNQYGQLGDGTTNNSATPVPVLGLDGVTAIAAGVEHTMAIKSDRTVWTWGYNRYGQLGNGTTNSSSMPMAVPGLDGVTAIAAGFAHTVAIQGDQTAWTWGDNQYGQLGNGTTNNSSKPVAVLGLDGVIAVAAGSRHTVAVKSDRTVWAWGNNGNGQLGDGTITTRLAPVQVQMKDGTPLTGVMALAAGERHTVALRDDHTVWAWGYNFYGAVGNGAIDVTPVVTPVPVPNIADAMAIAAGRQYTLALVDGGKVWTWGSYYGVEQWDRLNAALVKTAAGIPLTGITAIAAGEYHAVAFAADGGIWTWGKDSAPAIPIRLPATASAGIAAFAAGGGHTVIVVGTREEDVGVLE